MELPFDEIFFKAALTGGNIVWRKHVLEKMISRGISRYEVLAVMQFGEVVQTYGHDKPFPSVLLLGFPDSRPIHVVTSFDNDEGLVFVITTYEPDLNIFEDNLKTRRK